MKKSQHRFRIVVDFQFVTVPLGFGSGFILKNTTQSSLENIGNSALPPLFVISLYSTVKDRSIGYRYRDVDLIAHAFGIFEGVKTNKGPLMKVLRVNFAT